MSRHASDVVVVVAAIVEDNGKFLVSRRLEGTHLAGLWEFPGGKCAPTESHEDCLGRELREELGVEANIGAEILATEHDYPERRVRLHFRRCTIRGKPQSMLGQQIRWADRQELSTLQFPDADAELIKVLTQSTSGGRAL